MSANIYWHPIENNKKSVNVHAPSEFIRSMEEIFGNFPIKLNTNDVPILNAMATVYSDKSNNPYEHLVKILDKHDVIEITKEY